MCSFYFMWAVLPFICFLFSTLGKLMNKLDLNLMARTLQPRIRSCAEIPSDLMALDWDAAPAAAMLTSQETTEEHFHAALRTNDAEMRWNHLWGFSLSDLVFELLCGNFWDQNIFSCESNLRNQLIFSTEQVKGRPGENMMYKRKKCIFIRFHQYNK